MIGVKEETSMTKAFPYLNGFAICGLFFLTSCGKTVTTTEDVASALKDKTTPNQTIVAAAATLAECANGGVVLTTFYDANGDGLITPTETIVNSQKICSGTNGTNGSNGANGSQGFGAGIEVSSAGISCPSGGQILKTFVDFNNDGIMNGSESVSSVSTLCNGVNGSNGANGSDGLSAAITVNAATALQCPSGGFVYSTSVGTNPPSATIICNGLNGADGMNGNDGQNAQLAMGRVGAMVAGKIYSSCHHDYLFLPGAGGAPGWLLFRHQANGSADQGIGSTGFQVWNVDIANFALASEVSNITYCQLNWDSANLKLDFTVVDNTDGLAGTTGSIQF